MPVLSSSDATKRAIDPALHQFFLCPLTHQLMADPVVAADGHTYEREAIEQWLQHQQAHGKPLTSPKTNEPLAHSHLIPNHQLRALIREAHPDA